MNWILLYSVARCHANRSNDAKKYKTTKFVVETCMWDVGLNAATFVCISRRCFQKRRTTNDFPTQVFLNVKKMPEGEYVYHVDFFLFFSFWCIVMLSNHSYMYNILLNLDNKVCWIEKRIKLKEKFFLDNRGNNNLNHDRDTENSKVCPFYGHFKIYIKKIRFLLAQILL